ncbi:MAG: hypothetical protein A2X36_06225 [Elusimicrobia bacterium GWA2_69_24]|nr:MAG: hypothetical protein A2X36_06225 [Elusimicrobia bacterium GWA2_69_24]
MGSGKTRVGTALARRLGLPFLDTDAEAERISGRSVARLFREGGKAGFRRLEQRVIAAAAAGPIRVVAVGGGAVTRAANLRAMRRSGTVVRLRAPFSVIRRRIGKGAGRPLWDASGVLFRRREPLYRKAAHVAVDASGTPEAAARIIACRLGLERRSPAPSAPGELMVRTGSHSYPVLVGSGVLDAVPARLGRLTSARRAVLVSDARLAGGPGRRLAAAFRRSGWKLSAAFLPGAEGAKSLSAIARLYGFLLRSRTERTTPLVALGGGTVGDAAGFAAATYYRGIPLVHVPTTLLAQTDSAIGGKTGVNHPLAKNAVGAFHQPVLVAADTDLLASLPDREFQSGLAEVVKTALALDRDFAEGLLERWGSLQSRSGAELAWAVSRCVRLKAAAVAEDERDLSGRRELLNLGHTVGHALEAAAGFGRFRHGEAVAWGLRAAFRLSAERGWLADPGDRALASALLGRLRTPAWPARLSWSHLNRHLALDKKVRDGRSVMILLRRAGKAVRVPGVALGDIRRVVARLSTEARP